MNVVLCADAQLGSSCVTQVATWHKLPELPQDLVKKCLCYMPKFKMVGILPCLNKFWKEFVETGGFLEQCGHGDNINSSVGFLMYEMAFSQDFILNTYTLEHESFRWERAPHLWLRQSSYVGIRDEGELESTSDGYLLASIWTSVFMVANTLTAFYVWNPLRPSSPHEVKLKSPEMCYEKSATMVDAHLTVDKASTPSTFKVVMFNRDARNGGWIYSSSTHQWTAPEVNIYHIFERTDIERLDSVNRCSLRVSTNGCIYIAAQHRVNEAEFGVLCFDTQQHTWKTMMALNQAGSPTVSRHFVVRFIEALLVLPGPTLYLIALYQTHAASTHAGYSDLGGSSSTRSSKHSEMRHIWALDVGSPTGPTTQKWRYVGCGPEGANCHIAGKMVKWSTCVMKGANYICGLVWARSARTLTQPKDISILMYNIASNTWKNEGAADSFRVLPLRWKTMFDDNRFMPNYYPSWV